MYLYWVTVPGDDSEDWFIFSRDARTARSFHEECEGYSPGDAKAECIMKVPPSLKLSVKPPDHANLEDLEMLGFEILDSGDQYVRMVRKDGRTFTEGALESLVRTIRDDIFEVSGRGRPNKTKPRPTKIQVN